MFSKFSLLLFMAGLLNILTVPCTAAPQANKVLTTLPYHFTLAAYSLNGPNANGTGVPLVLAPDGATTGEEFQVSATWASTGSNDFPSLALVDSQLRAFFANGEWLTNATAPSNGNNILWVTTNFEPPPPVYGFTAVAEPSQKYPELAWQGQTNVWSLCPGSFRALIFYKLSPLGNCFPVRLNMVKI